MNLLNYGLHPQVIEIIRTIAESLDNKHPAEGEIENVDGAFADVRTAKTGTVLRHCPVLGDPSTLVPGQLVGLRWIDNKPFVLATSLGTSVYSGMGTVIEPDGVTLQNSPYGVRVVPGSIQLSHLAFQPALEGHTHKDSLSNNGWAVTNDGVIYQGDVNIHPTGQISLGLSPNVIKLDAQHATHRIWVGDVLPANADFSVEKDGKMNASAGTIAGWDILSDRLSKNDTLIKAAGEIILGTGNDVAAMSSVDVSGYRLWIGHTDPDLAPFRVKKTGEVWLDNAHVAMTLESSNYTAGQQGWKLDNTGWAEFQEVTVRGTFTAVTFKNDITSVLSGKQVVTDGATIISDVAASDSTIDLDVNIFDQNDILFTQPRPGVSEHMQVLSGPTAITGGYRYNVYRDLANLSDYFTDVETTVGAANLAGYWRMSEVGIPNPYLTFNGTNASVNFSSPAALDDLHDGSFTIEGWVKLDDINQTTYLFNKTNASNQGWRLVFASGAVQFRVYEGTGTTSTAAYTLTGNVANDEWFHIAAHFNDAGDRKAYLAINGTWGTAGTALTNPVGSDAALNFYIGYSGSLWLDGAVGWVRVSDNDRQGAGVNFTPPSRTVIPTADGNTIALWPLNEGGGTTAFDSTTNSLDGTISNGDWGRYVAHDASDAGNNGTYTAVALMNRPNPVPVGGFAPKFVPPNSVLDIYSAGFNTDFNGAEGSFGMWAKISDSSVWTDGTQDWLMFVYVDNSNYFQIFKNSTSNQMLFTRAAGGTTKTVTTTYSNTDWFHVGMTWSETAGELKAYIDGVQVGTTQTSIGTWSGGAITSTGAAIGGYHTYWVDRKWDGWLSNAFHATTPLSAASMLEIGSPNGSGVTLYAGENIFRKGSGTLPDPAMTFGSYDIWMGGYETSFGGHAIERAGGYLTLDGSRDIGPFFGVARRFGANYNQIQDVVRIGRLEGFLQIPGNQYGIGIGDALRNMTYTYEDGLQIKTRGGLSRIDDDGITSDQFSIEPTADAPDYILDRAILYVDQSTNQLRVRFRDASTETDKLILQL